MTEWTVTYWEISKQLDFIHANQLYIVNPELVQNPLKFLEFLRDDIVQMRRPDIALPVDDKNSVEKKV